MTTALIILGILAGLFAGIAGGLIYLVRLMSDAQRRVDAERMLALNKAFVRDGQARLFSDAMIAGEEDLETEGVKAVSIKPVSPFQNGLRRAHEKVDQAKKAVALPPEVKERIQHAAELKRNGTA